LTRGFTLIEVVVAFAIAALCLGAASRVFSGAARHVGLLQERMRALSGAEAVMAAAGVSEALVPGVVSGALSGGLRWRRIVEPYAREEAVDGATPVWVAYRVTVEVDRDAGQIVSISSVRLGKTP
jgi:general secretion pathway protein I